jgi:hypothetical protein
VRVNGAVATWRAAAAAAVRQRVQDQGEDVAGGHNGREREQRCGSVVSGDLLGGREKAHRFPGKCVSVDGGARSALLISPCRRSSSVHADLTVPDRRSSDLDDLHHRRVHTSGGCPRHPPCLDDP